MKIILVILGTLAVLTVLFYLFLRHYGKELSSVNFRFTSLPSGKELPSDEKLFSSSEEELRELYTDDLVWLRDYALFIKDGTFDDTIIAQIDKFLERVENVMHS